MAFFKREHKQIAKTCPYDYLRTEYENSERKLRQLAKQGDTKALAQAMKEHGKIEYALLYKSTPEFKEKEGKR